MKPVLNKSKSLESLREKKLRSKYGKYTDKKVQAKKNIIKRNKSSNTLDINKIENKLYEAKKNFDLEWKMNQRFDKVDEALKDIKTTMNGMNDSIALMENSVALMENSVALMVGLSLYNSPLISEELKPKLTSKLNTQINKFVAGMDREPNIINTNKKNMETNIFNSKKYEEPKVKEKDEKPKKKFSFKKKIKKPLDNDSSKLSIQSLIKNTSESISSATSNSKQNLTDKNKIFKKPVIKKPKNNSRNLNNKYNVKNYNTLKIKKEYKSQYYSYNIAQKKNGDSDKSKGESNKNPFL